MSDVASQVEPTMEDLLKNASYLSFPKTGAAVRGEVLSLGRREIRLDLSGWKTGVIRGRALFRRPASGALHIGDEVEAIVVEPENEQGEVELAFGFGGAAAGLFDEARRLWRSAEVVDAKVAEANKGGLMVDVAEVRGFLPVSQLAPEHYPRVSGGDKMQIWQKLKEFVGQTFRVRILDVQESERKLIVSEKAVWEDEQRQKASKHRVGETVEGEISSLTDFGAFVRFDALEGLVHISELAWQRIDHPRDVVQLGQKVRAEILAIEGAKIFLSVKKLLQDPWAQAGERYHVDDVVEGKILKMNPFGFFVELDPEIHGLAHVSELSAEPVADLSQLAQVGDVLKFRIISLDPVSHRLGLSLKALKEPRPVEESPVEESVEPQPIPTSA